MDWIGQTVFYSVWEPNTAILYRFADLEELYSPYGMQLKSWVHENDSFLFLMQRILRLKHCLEFSKRFWSTYVSLGNQQ